MNTNLRCCCLTAAALAGLLPAASAADITGKITFKGTPPAEVAIPFDPSCGKLHTEKATTHHYLVGPNGELVQRLLPEHITRIDVLKNPLRAAKRKARAALNPNLLTGLNPAGPSAGYASLTHPSTSVTA